MELLDQCPTLWLSAGLLAVMFMANETGFRFGVRRCAVETEASRSVCGSLKASVYGLVALLLAFSFSMTTAKHDLRRRVVLDESNAIGTCHLRAGLLPDRARDRMREILKRYLDVRLDYYAKGLDREELLRTTREMDQQLSALWKEVEAVGKSDPESLRGSQFVPAANQLIDQAGVRAWAARNHLPIPVLTLLVGCVLVASVLIGNSSGQAGRRHLGHWASLNILFSLVLFVVLDFDRPRRGLIQVDHKPLLELRESLDQPRSLPTD